MISPLLEILERHLHKYTNEQLNILTNALVSSDSFVSYLMYNRPAL